jgi:hypothetical protein
MKKVADIFQRKGLVNITIEPSSEVIQALKLMAEKNPALLELKKRFDLDLEY